jgi:lipopolysaccharide/colanic/teichoic acid biosynthesis glycosyltransferase
MGKRFIDVVVSGLGLIFLALLFVVLAVWIKLDSRGPVFFRQLRVGRFGAEFRIFKFRTMQVDAERKGMQLTVGADARITDSGAFLRRYKLDELPQLLNVLNGDMSLVGPRPEVPRYVAIYPSAVRDIVLSVRPGITDLASIAFRNENQLLSESKDPEKTYVEEIIPIKLRYYTDYVRNRSTLLDLKIALLTLRAIAFGKQL